MKLAQVPPVLDAEAKRAVHAFEQRLESKQGAGRWALKVTGATIKIDTENSRVLRSDADGKLHWETPLDDLRHRSWPSLLSDGHRIFVKQQFKGVTALDPQTGKVVWSVEIPNECFWLSENLLYLAQGREVVAVSSDAGTEVFRLTLPAEENFRPMAIEEAAGLLMVQTGEAPGGIGDTFLFDKTGQIRHRFPRQVVAMAAADQDRVFLTSADVRRVTPNDQTVWSAAFESRQWLAGGKVFKAPDGDIVVFLYGRISNSGVQLMRVDPVSGKKRWQVLCNPLSNVWHSAYKHDVDVEWHNGQLLVVSHGSSGDFVEWLDGKTGKQFRRSELRK